MAPRPMSSMLPTSQLRWWKPGAFEWAKASTWWSLPWTPCRKAMPSPEWSERRKPKHAGVEVDRLPHIAGEQEDVGEATRMDPRHGAAERGAAGAGRR